MASTTRASRFTSLSGEPTNPSSNTNASAAPTSSFGNNSALPSFDSRQWEDELSKVDISKHDLNSLVFDYLLIEGYSEAAVEFARETGLPADVDHEKVQERMEIRQAVEDGRVEEAVRRVNELDPEILDTNPPLLFHLHLLRLIELIRSDQIDLALQFATTELAPRGAQNPEFLVELERTMALLAFPDLARFADDSTPSASNDLATADTTMGMADIKSAVAVPDLQTVELFQEPVFKPIISLMKRSHRIKISKELNSAILENQGHGKETKLNGLIKLMAFGEKHLIDHGLGLPVNERFKGRQWADKVLSSVGGDDEEATGH
ncbi:uncharacterized protein I303_103255 [Kwoniella dejecticola CBS 10117]|uniref:CTLH domain-containing protein n=1 Tax=Kwoniella dejecticola CBS 10117 TaxID=1296121 RepID=A0A1A6AB30_9TREE|nr:uncharacterized protein I303_03278 [Kwoniella dejecticola CBS 10117]OBR87253.1 hypothetical protein I303_03278 [Kwoniella dejecticola CBS 10117]